MELRGAGAVVTGAGRGLGAALAERLARAGARVVLVARNRTELDVVAARIRAEGGDAHVLVADVGDKRAVYPIAGAAEALAGPIDLVVHAASDLGHVPLRLLLDTDCEELEHVLAVNLVGPFRLTKALAGPMVLRGRGAVVNVTSDASVAAYPRWGAYGVSKAALDHLGRVWGAELAGSGVRFVTVDPGEMDTKMHADAMPEADRTTLPSPDAAADKIIAMIQAIEGVPVGARLEASSWTPASAAPGTATGTVAATAGTETRS
jgi:NAD(P)-dependent dehydrogenase (short-subunit alcohol dehydrogenase family)